MNKKFVDNFLEWFSYYIVKCFYKMYGVLLDLI